MNKTIIYIADVSLFNDEDTFNKFYNIMPKYRQEKIDRFKFKKDKNLSLGAGVILKKACINFNIKNSDDNIILNECGKPYFKDIKMYFSLSHSNEMVACALSYSDVGCDIEYIKDVKENVSKKVFTEKEIIDFNTNQNDGFFTLWTLKESYLKKIGKGFFKDPKEVSFNKNKTLDFDIKTKFFVKEIKGYKIACAYETQDIELNVINLSVDSIGEIYER